MKSQEFIPILLAMVGPMLLPLASEATLPVYREGHSDLVPLYETGPDRFEFGIRFNANLTYEDGSPIPPPSQPPAANSVAIRVGDPPLVRELDESGFFTVDRRTPEWDFLGVEVDEPFWNLHQDSTPGFPFLGITNETLSPLSDWSGSFVWSLRDVLVAPEVDGVSGVVSLWQHDGFNEVITTPRYGRESGVYFVSLDGVDEEEDYFHNSTDNAGHDHYNWSFSLPGVYEVIVGLNAMHTTAGEVDGTTSLTFLVGDDASLTDPISQPGDFNGDDIVNLADYAVWRDNLGAAEDGSVLAGNGNGGLVDATDYQDWKDLFGTDYSSSSAIAAQTVSEPTTLLGMTFGSALALGVARRTRRCM